MVWRGFCAVYRVRVHSYVAANECKCAKTRCQGAGKINWTSYLQGKAILHSVVTHKDNTRLQLALLFY